MNNLKLLAFVMACCISVPAYADLRLQVTGNTLTLNGDIEPAAALDDANALRSLIDANMSLNKIVLTGSFPKTGAAMDVANVIDDMGLATEVTGKCSEACIYMFVSGRPHVLAEGARLGLRRRTLDVEYLRESFEAGKARYGWSDEFGQAAVMYDRGQADMRWSLLHLTRHGVSLDFALRIFATPREDMWWPEHGELVSSGMIK